MTPQPAGQTKGAVLTTGVSSGIGLATVLEVARRGYHSIGTVRSPAKAEVVRRAAAGAGVEVEVAILDVTDASGCARVVRGRELYGLVNNAGFAVQGAVEETSDDDARQLVETLLVAPMRLARLALPGMRAHGRGRIVNVSSVTGRVRGLPLSGWYGATKHALESLSDSLRVEVAGSGVRVVLVEPGAVRTNIWDGLRDGGKGGDGATREPAYAAAHDRSRSVIGLLERFLNEPAAVARVIVDTLDASRPRSRYLVGKDAYAMMATDPVTPTPVRDRMYRAIYRL